jgi:hypothetical protein
VLSFKIRLIFFLGNLNSYLLGISTQKTDQHDLGQVRLSLLMRLFSLELLQMQFLGVGRLRIGKRDGRRDDGGKEKG